MIIVENNILPIPGFYAMTIYPFIFVRKKVNPSNSPGSKERREQMLNHEFIHGAQQLDFFIISLIISAIVNTVGCLLFNTAGCLLFTCNILTLVMGLLIPFIAFYIVYGLNYLINIIRGCDDPYKEIVFEREAYSNDLDFEYLKTRKWTDIFKYIKKK